MYHSYIFIFHNYMFDRRSNVTNIATDKTLFYQIEMTGRSDYL